MAQTVNLEFPDDYPGEVFTVQISPITMADLYGFRTAWAKDNSYEGLREQFDRFAELAHPTWTVPGVESIDGLAFHVVMGLVNGWLNAIGEVPPPLAVRSAAGGRSPAESTEEPAAPSSPRRSSSRR